MLSTISNAKVFRVAGFATLLVAMLLVTGCGPKYKAAPPQVATPEDIKQLIGQLAKKQKAGFGIDDIRIPAAKRLGDIGPQAKEAIPALEKMAKDKDPAAKQAAEEALAKLKAA
ncbi:MAG TPA: hypothetical protein VGN12_15145 [Pirellulales bacterium]|jgi:HEAT repeat protein